MVTFITSVFWVSCFRFIFLLLFLRLVMEARLAEAVRGFDKFTVQAVQYSTVDTVSVSLFVFAILPPLKCSVMQIMTMEVTYICYTVAQIIVCWHFWDMLFSMEMAQYGDLLSACWLSCQTIDGVVCHKCRQLWMYHWFINCLSQMYFFLKTICNKC